MVGPVKPAADRPRGPRKDAAQRLHERRSGAHGEALWAPPWAIRPRTVMQRGSRRRHVDAASRDLSVRSGARGERCVEDRVTERGIGGDLVPALAARLGQVAEQPAGTLVEHREVFAAGLWPRAQANHDLPMPVGPMTTSHSRSPSSINRFQRPICFAAALPVCPPALRPLHHAGHACPEQRGRRSARASSCH